MDDAGLNDGEIAHCFRLFSPDSTLVLASGSQRCNLFSTNHCADSNSFLFFKGSKPMAKTVAPSVSLNSAESGSSYCQFNFPSIEPLHVYTCEMTSMDDSEVGSYVGEGTLSLSQSEEINTLRVNLCKPGIEDISRRDWKLSCTPSIASELSVGL